MNNLGGSSFDSAGNTINDRMNSWGSDTAQSANTPQRPGSQTIWSQDQGGSMNQYLGMDGSAAGFGKNPWMIGQLTR